METNQPLTTYQPKNHIRIVTAASLFDGHDAAINIMRRIMQRSGAEIIHLGHNRSAKEIVDTAIQEDVQGIALTSYQGGHNEYFKYIFDMLRERGAGHIKIFGGGGGTILPEEINALQKYGITRIYSPDDGRHMGLQGMINDVLQECDFPLGDNVNGELKKISKKDHLSISRLITAVENYPEENAHWIAEITSKAKESTVPVLGITGTGGAGKSSMIDEIIRRFLLDFPEKDLAVISVDPSKRKTGGALLGDRIRMNTLISSRVYMRSLATRQSNLALSKHIRQAVDILKAAAFDLIILETSGIGQSDTEIVDHADMSLYIMTPEFGAASQLEKIDMLDFADVIAINKFDKRGAQDALRDVRKQYKRNHELWDVKEENIPVFGTIASQFNDPGTNALYKKIIETLTQKTKKTFQSTLQLKTGDSEKIYIIPPHRIRYLSEIADNNRKYDDWAKEEAEKAALLYALKESAKHFEETGTTDISAQLNNEYEKLRQDVHGDVWRWLEEWPAIRHQYVDDDYSYKVRDKVIKVDTHVRSLSGTRIPVVALPVAKDWGTLVNWVTQENLPGRFPYTAGIFPFKRKGEDPTRMFAGEGGPERTNKRFHYVSKGMPAIRLSTAFDSVTLYGEDPDYRPDIYGKIGNAGVSICSMDDAKRLYSGFDLCDPKTSVSMTINGPAATICAFFMNAAIDQQCELYIKANKLEDKVEVALKKKFDQKGLPRPTYSQEIPEGNNGLGLMLLGLSGDEVLDADTYNTLKAKALQSVRGTVQADILKEDQAQNTCIFSTEFSLRLMGDMQAYFIDSNIRNFYSVSISGYHIA
ncbi:MAG TPA: methylmalonyl-CoA mutase family protein, partial [Saprospiraceae bacterium]